MKVKIENLKDSQKSIKVEVEAERVSSALNEIYTDIEKVAQLPGFRKGKAPLELVKTHYENTANEELLNRLVWDCYHEAIKGQNIGAIGYPVIENIDFKKDKPLTFTVKVDVRPEFKLKNYKGIKVKEDHCDVTDIDIDKALKNLQEAMAEYKTEEKRPIAKGDYIICKFECYCDGKLVDKNDKLWLYINDELKPKELLDILPGAGMDEQKETEAALPEDYQNKALAGKKAVYKITPQEIKRKVLPEINDDLAKATNHFKDLEELKKHFRENILNSKKSQTRRGLESQIFDNLLKNHSFEVPLSMVQRQSERLIDDAKHKLFSYGVTKEEIDKQEKQIAESVKGNAVNDIRVFFILEKIAQEENISIGEDEIEKEIQEAARLRNENYESLKKKLHEKGAIEGIKEQMLHGKVVEFLIKEAKVN